VSAGPSLYRRHRPRTFADVVGQEHVVRTLRNAVEQGKVHHAYLFVGSRGTGKTSMAKILAACLNCESAPTHPTTEPCGVCPSCRSIAAATSLDVIEMDAASNNSVDDIRELRESVAYAPSAAGRRSTSSTRRTCSRRRPGTRSSRRSRSRLRTRSSSWPPRGQKVLPTVVDRCHRFDFGRPTADQLAAVVRAWPSRRGSRSAPTRSVSWPAMPRARSATRSGRSSSSSPTPGATSPPTTCSPVLGIADADLLFGAVDAVAAGDAAQALRAAAQVAGTGRDLTMFAKDLETHARELLVVQTLGEIPAELHVTAERDERLAEQARRIAGADVVRLIDLLAAALRAVKDGADARTQLELALVKAAAPEVDPSARALLARIERLEVGRGGAAAAAPREATAPTPPAQATVTPPDPEPAPSPSARPAREAALAPAVAVAEPAPAGRCGAPPTSRTSTACAPSGRRSGRRALRQPAPRRGAVGGSPVELRGGELVVAFADGQASTGGWPTAGEPRATRGRPAPPARRWRARVLRAAGARRRGGPGAATPHGRGARRPLQGGVRRRGDPPRSRAPEWRRLMPQPNMQQMLRQVQKMQQQMAEAQEQLKHEEVEASAAAAW
jgi:DNA polymerase-3 subunit gamma/tau